MAERRPDEHRTGDAPEKDERLAVEQREGERNHGVQAERARNPRRDVGLGQAALRANREDDRHRPGAGEEKRHHRGGGVMAAEIRGDLSWRGDRK